MGTAVFRFTGGYVDNNGWTTTGGSLLDVLDDNSDATYIEATGVAYVTLDIQDAASIPFAWPALSQIRSVTPRLRASQASGTARAGISFKLSPAYGAGGPSAGLITPAVAIATQTLATLTASPSGGAWTAADVDALRAYLTAEDSPSAIRIYELYIDAVYNEAPVVSAVAPSSVVTSRPTITWTYTDPELDAQERLRVKVFTAAQYGAGGFDPETAAATWDSGETYSSVASLAVGGDLQNATTYRAYVKAADVGSAGRYGLWAYGEFTIALAAPATPAIILTSEPERARNKLLVIGQQNLLTGNEASAETAADHMGLPYSPEGTWVFATGAGAVVKTELTTATVTKPTGEGGILLAFVMSPATATHTAPAGWTLHQSWVSATADAAGVRLSVYWKIGEPSDPANWAWTLSVGADSAAWIGRYHGVDLSRPFYGSEARNTDAAATSLQTLASFVVGDDPVDATNALVVTAFAHNPNGITSGTTTYSTPGSTISRYDGVAVADGSNLRAGLKMVDENKATEGMLNTRISTASHSGKYIAAQVALRRAAGPGVGRTTAQAASGASSVAIHAFAAGDQVATPDTAVTPGWGSTLGPSADYDPAALANVAYRMGSGGYQVVEAGGVVPPKPTTALDVRIRVGPQYPNADWTPFLGWTLWNDWWTAALGLSRAWLTRVNDDGKMSLTLSSDGTAEAVATSSVALPFAAFSATDYMPYYLRWTWRASDGRVQFFWSADGATWTPLGADQTIAIASINAASTADRRIGTHNQESLVGFLYWGEVRHAIDGAVITRWDARDAKADSPGGGWDATIGNPGDFPQRWTGSTGEDWYGNNTTNAWYESYNSTYTALVSLKGATVGRQIQAGIDWSSFGGSPGAYPPLGMTWGPLVTETTTGFTQAALVGIQPPVNAASMRPVVRIVAAAAPAAGAAEIHWADKWSIARGASAVWGAGNVVRQDGTPAFNVGSTITIERSVDGGTTWVPIRAGDDIAYGWSIQDYGSYYDYEVVRGVEARYRARVSASGATGKVTSANSPVVTTTILSTGWWLKDLAAPGYNMQLHVQPGFSFRRKEPQAVYEPLGGAASVVVSDGVKGIEGSMDVWLKREEEYAALEALLGSGRVLWLEDVLGRAWYVKIGSAHAYEVIRAAPFLYEAWPEGRPIRHFHQTSLPFVEVGKPSDPGVAISGDPQPASYWAIAL